MTSVSPRGAYERPRVLITAPRARLVIDRYRRELGSADCDVDVLESPERLEESDLLPVIGEYDAVICGDDRITSRVLGAATRLKLIAKWGTGIDSIDLDEARRRGVTVCNTPDAFSDPVADSVMGYALLFARGLDRMTREMRAGGWNRLPLRALNECTIGIVGLGNIGSAVARRAASFGMRILASDVRPLEPVDGVSFVSLETLLRGSDFVTLHADLRPANRHVINRARLAMMQPTAVLINTARGPLVDEDALAAAVREGRLAGAALDVFEHEPLPLDSPLRSMANVYLAPHNANSSAAAADRVHANTIRNVVQMLKKVM